MHATLADPPHFWRQLLVLSVMLALLFAVLQPPPTAHLGFFTALLAWLLHVGIGMLCAVAATRALLQWLPFLPGRPWLALLGGGLLGGMMFAPMALGLERLFPSSPQPADDWLEHWEAAGGAYALVAEFLSLLPSYLAAWLLVNAAPMLRVTRPQLGLGQSGPPIQGVGVEGEAESSAPTDPLPVLQLPASASRSVTCVVGPDPALKSDGAKPLSGQERQEDGLLQRLPLAVGRQLVSISADLHYLHVTTRRGRAIVLGSLIEAEGELGQRGIRIHRSHWVAFDAVRRLRQTAKGWRCELIDGQSLPVSRRRVAEAKQRLGTDFVVER